MLLLEMFSVSVIVYKYLTCFTGEITIVGPPLSSLDAELAFQQEAVARSKDARKQAQMNAAAQEARGMLGKPSHLTKLLAQHLSLDLLQP